MVGKSEIRLLVSGLGALGLRVQAFGGFGFGVWCLRLPDLDFGFQV